MWLLARCFRYVYSCVVLRSAVFQFLSAVLCVSLLFVLGSLLFQLGVSAFGGASHSSPLLRLVIESS